LERNKKGKVAIFNKRSMTAKGNDDKMTPFYDVQLSLQKSLKKSG